MDSSSTFNDSLFSLSKSDNVGSCGNAHHNNNHAGNNSSDINEEFQRLLDHRDSRLKMEFNRRESSYRREMQMLKEEIALLREQNSHSRSGTKGMMAMSETFHDDDTLRSDFLNDMTQHSNDKHYNGTTECSRNSKLADDGSLPSVEERFKKLERQMNQIELGNTKMKKGDDDPEDEGIHLQLFPEDTFSYLAFSEWNSTSMWTAISVVVIQLTTLSVLFVDFLSVTTPGNLFGVPVSVNVNTAVIQVIAIFIIVFSQGDLQDSLNLLFMGYDKEELEKNLHMTITYPRWLISLLTRLIVTIFGLVIVFMMIVREFDVTQLLLDFTSIEFVTNIDNIFFWLTAWGYLGLSAQRDATIVVMAKAAVLVQDDEESDSDDSTLQRHGTLTPLQRLTSSGRTKRHLHVQKAAKNNLNPRPACEGVGAGKGEQDMEDFSIHSLSVSQLTFGKEHLSRLCSRFPRLLFIFITFMIMVTCWAFNFYWQQTGAFVCQNLFVQFNDIYHPGLATFSGKYIATCGDNGFCRRVTYVESGHGNYSETARFFFCEDIRFWVFAFDEGGQFDCKDWVLKSPYQNIRSTASYNILTTVRDIKKRQWTILVDDRRELPIPEFTLECYDCKYKENFCGGEGRGKCVNNQCVCEDGWYGYRCDLFMPCDILEVNPLHNTVPAGLRTLSGKYLQLVAPLAEEDRDNNKTTSSKILTKYSRPTYIGGTDTDSQEFIFYNGRRWVNVVLESSISVEEMKYAILDLHGYWTNYTAAFITGPVDVNTPEDSADPSRLDWLQTNPPNVDVGRVQGPQKNNFIDLRLLCASCNNSTNPCFYGGNCTADAVCKCPQGKGGGQLCQIPTTKNGYCDSIFNAPQYDFDGGDCCKGTCVSTVEHECGVVRQSTDMGTTLEYIGFPSCSDPNAIKRVSGSYTIYRIIERGKVICGIWDVKLMIPFYHAQCQAIAAAVLGDKNLYEVDYWGASVNVNRYFAMTEGKFDITFGSDYLANRDIFEKKSRMPFSFARMPYYFAGLTFGGIPRFVQCADNHDYISPACQGVKICMDEFTSWYDVVTSIFPPENVIGTQGIEFSVTAVQKGLCNVLGATRFEVIEESIVALGYDISNGYAVGKRMHSKSFETWMTRSDDRQWTKMTSWIFEALVQAEQSNITQTSAALMKSTKVFNDQRRRFDNLFRNAVGANGNFGEMWDSTMPFSRSPMDHICNGTSGLIVSQSFGSYEDVGDRPREGGHIERIIQRGALVCAVEPAIGFATFNKQTNGWSGIEADICRAIAAAIFNGSPKVDFVNKGHITVFEGIKNGLIDISTGKTRTLEREIKHSSSGGFAFDFSPPYFYDGMIFAGFEPYGQCAANLLFDDGCADTLICVPESSTWQEALVELGVPNKNILLTRSTSEALERHLAMECNTVVHESHKLNQPLVSKENYFVSTKQYTDEPLSLMHRSDDPQFSDLIRWIVYGLFYAEEEGITQEMSIRMPNTNLFGSELTGIWQNSVEASGGYGEIFARNLDGIVARSGLNLLNKLDGPQLCAAPGTAPLFP